MLLPCLLQVTGLFLLVQLFFFVNSDPDASSTSHVSISLGKSNVKYNNDHIPDASYSVKHFSPTPFIHSTPSPHYYQDYSALAHPHPSISPMYGSTVGPFYHSTPPPLYYGSTPKYYIPSTTKYDRVHEVHMPKDAKKEKSTEIYKPKVVDDMMKDHMKKEMKKKEEIEVKMKDKKIEEKKVDVIHDTHSKPEIHQLPPKYTPSHHYHPSEEPLYIPKRHYMPHPVRPIHKPGYPHSSYQPVHKPADPHHEEGYKPDSPPKCAVEGKYFCDKDEHYPEYEIMNAAQKHADQLLDLYADVADLNTELSVDLPKKANGDESYLCPADITYAQIFRAKNSDGKWRLIVNNIKVNYQKLTQTVRLEECLTSGESCPLIPHCYESKCLQKSIYHRFLVYNPYDHYFPFAIETFKLPSSCACHLSKYEITH